MMKIQLPMLELEETLALWTGTPMLVVIAETPVNLATGGQLLTPRVIALPLRHYKLTVDDKELDEKNY